jgi:hypothetical protein
MIKKRLPLLFMLLVIVLLAFLVNKCGPKAIVCNVYSYTLSIKSYVDEYLDCRDEYFESFETLDRFEMLMIRSKLESLLSKIDSVRCKDEFSLEHKTLKKSIEHMIHSIDYVEKRDFATASDLLDEADLNFMLFLKLLELETE